MNDRELLELAANAYWAQELADDEITIRYSESDDGILYLHADNQDHNGDDREFRWNPLVESHDALELAVRLGLHIRPYKTICICGTAHDMYLANEDIAAGDDPNAATRRAIVRAAAEIGKAEDRG